LYGDSIGATEHTPCHRREQPLIQNLEQQMLPVFLDLHVVMALVTTAMAIGILMGMDD